MPRYLTDEEKNRKRQLIFDNAISMFDHMLFREITISSLAKKCKIAKGTIFKYFDTKETLFSFILYGEYEKWAEEELKFLNSREKFTKDEFIKYAEMRTEYIFNNHIRLVRLTSIKRTILDKNIDSKIFAKQVEKFTGQIAEVAKVASEKTQEISYRDMFEFYQAWHMAVVGSYNLGMSRENIDKIKKEGVSQKHIIDVKRTAVRSISNYLKGLNI